MTVTKAIIYLLIGGILDFTIGYAIYEIIWALEEKRWENDNGSKIN